MLHRDSRGCPRTVCRLLGWALAVTLLPSVYAAEGELTFEEHVRPIFREHCFDCHGATEKIDGGLDLRLVRFMTAGGESGPAIEPGDPEASFLLDRVRSAEMPPGDARLSSDEIATLEQWIAGGSRTVRPEPESIGPGVGITPEDRAFWAFRPIDRPEVEVPPSHERIRTPIDALLLAAMPDGMSFSEDADRFTLVKRAYFDLVGLPPSPSDLERILNDPDPEWYANLLNELLESPHYGERWGRHWLDVAGYADSEGYTTADAERAWAWKYRDYVIQSLNDNKPWDKFITEQLAGDELAGPINGDLTPEQIELLTATGFLRMAADGTGSGANDAAGRNQVMADTLRIVSTTFLGMSVACAQCHDHRYDPIPQTDYYALRAVFEPALDWQSWKVPPQRLQSLYTAADREAAAAVEAEAAKVVAERTEKQKEYMAQALEKELMKYEEPLRTELETAYQTAGDKRTPEQQALLKKYPSVNISPGVLYQYLPDAAEDLKKYDARIAEIRAKKPKEEFLRVLMEPAGHAPSTRLFHRGDHEQPLQEVLPGGLSVVADSGSRVQFPKDDETMPTTGRRTAFAAWLTGGDQPLAARVLVNRVWLHHFGKGLVSTPADFGRLGVAPSHPALLDWLADEFVRSGWDLKQLHRLIMTSTAWRQSSHRDPQRDAIDPTNRYYWRQNVVRLEAETLRDRMLAVSGRLDRNLFGPPVQIQEDETGQVVVAGEQRRRSLYIKARRSLPVAMLQAFDAPVMETNCEMRPVSTVATQSLMLMNGEFSLAQAGHLAESTRSAEVTDDIRNLVAGAPPFPPEVWSFGYASVNESDGSIRFEKLPHWTGSAWQGGTQLPDPALGWVRVTAVGGHTGSNPDFTSVKRWTAPADGNVTIQAELQHGSENGDGVRGRIVSSGGGVLGEWTIQNGTVRTDCSAVAVQAGDTLDFVTDCRGSVTSDGFTWKATVTLSREGESPQVFDSAAGFHGPETSPAELLARAMQAWTFSYGRPPTPEELITVTEFLGTQTQYFASQRGRLTEGMTPADQALTSLCQVLLTSNEFLYVD